MMPSPFPGMDPYLEGPVWPDFHNSFLVTLRATLTPKLTPRYFVTVEERVVLEPLDGDEPRVFVPEVGVARGESSASERPAAASSGAVVLEPAVLPRPRFLKRRQVYLNVTDAESREVVTAIELLSPSNKTPGERNEYLVKRDALLDAGVSLLELDLLRGGRRLPTAKPLPAGDCHAFLSRGDRPTEVSVFSWTLRDPLPVPLRSPDPDLVVELQPVLDRVIDEAGFAYRLPYGESLSPPLAVADARWASEVVAAASIRRKRPS